MKVQELTRSSPNLQPPPSITDLNKLLKAIEAPPPPQEQVPLDSSVKREYIDVAFEAMSFKMKEILSKEEIMDLVEDLQQLVNRACREKRRCMELVTNPPLPPQHPL